MNTNYYLKEDMLKHISLPGELWKEVTGSNGRYRVSNMGRIVSMNRYTIDRGNGKVGLMHPAKDANGYLRTMIKIEGKDTTIKMHRVVAQHWVPNPDNKPQVNHIDHDRTNNAAANLEWVTFRENIDHMMRAGRQTMNNGEKNGMHILTEDQVAQIKRDYIPFVVTRKMLAERYGCTVACIKDIFRGRSWKHVK